MMRNRFQMKTFSRTLFRIMKCYRILMIVLSIMKRRFHQKLKDHLKQVQYHMSVSCLRMMVQPIQKTYILVSLNCRVAVSKLSLLNFRRRVNKFKTKSMITSNETRVGRKVIQVGVRLTELHLILSIKEELEPNKELRVFSKLLGARVPV